MGYILITAPIAAIAYWFAHTQSAMGYFGAGWTMVFGLCLMGLWRARK